ncbi:hypothetical protein ACFPRL_29235 [Pseudoclavibacter helvolus]
MVGPSAVGRRDGNDDRKGIRLFEIQIAGNHEGRASPRLFPPRAGASSTHTTSPRERSATVRSSIHIAEFDVPVAELIPVVVACATNDSSERLHSPTSLIAIQQAFDETCGCHPALLGIPIDAVTKLFGDFDCRRHQRSVPIGKPVLAQARNSPVWASCCSFMATRLCARPHTPTGCG